MNSADQWRRNLLLLNAISFARTFMVIMPVFVPLMQSYGLTMQETMLLQSIFAGVSLVMELPSGYIADVFGRKTTLTIGYILAGAGFTQVIWADTFLELAIFEVTLGFAMSFISGSDTALAFESEKALGEDGSHSAIARTHSWMNFGEGAAAFAAFILVKYDFKALLWAQAIAGWVPFALSFGLVEAPRIASKGKKSMIAALFIVRRSPIVIAVTVVFVITMSMTYLVAWLNQSLWQSVNISVEYFGLLWGLFALTVGLSARLSTRLPEHIGPMNAFAWLGLLLLVGYLALSSQTLWAIVFGGLLICVFRGIAAPKMKVKINKAIDNEYRATINSLVGASFRIATLFLGPVMGWVVDAYSAQIAAMALIGLVAPSMIGLYVIGVIKPNPKTLANA